MDPDDYAAYDEKANGLLDDAAYWHDTMSILLNPVDVISYLIRVFDIHFIGFTVVPAVFSNLRASKAANYPVDFDKIVLVDSAFTSTVDGFTEALNDHFVVFLNLDLDNGRRGLFTLLHELVHIRFHLAEPQYYSMCAKLAPNQKYPEELLPYEDEANAIASILLINDDQLFEELASGTGFDDMADAHYMSHSALHNRLKNYLAYTVGANKALGLVCQFRYQHDVTGIQSTLSNWVSMEPPF